MADNPTDPNAQTNTQPQQPQPSNKPSTYKLDIDKIKKINRNILYISSAIGIVLILIGLGYYAGIQTGAHSSKTSTTIQTTSIVTTTIASNLSQNTTVSTTTIPAVINTNTTFIAVCLPNGKQWSVTLSNSIARENYTQNSTINLLTFSKSPGAYTFKAHINPSQGYQLSPGMQSNYSGNVVIYPNSNGITGLGTVTQLMFAPTSTAYTITFKEVGLPRNTRWGVTLNYTYTQCTNINSVQTIYTSANNVSVKFQNGSLSYTIDPFAGYTATPTTGNFQISGNKTVSISLR